MHQPRLRRPRGACRTKRMGHATPALTAWTTRRARARASSRGRTTTAMAGREATTTTARKISTSHRSWTAARYATPKGPHGVGRRLAGPYCLMADRRSVTTTDHAQAVDGELAHSVRPLHGLPHRCDHHCRVHACLYVRAARPASLVRFRDLVTYAAGLVCGWLDAARSLPLVHLQALQLERVVPCVRHDAD